MLVESELIQTHMGEMCEVLCDGMCEGLREFGNDETKEITESSEGVCRHGEVGEAYTPAFSAAASGAPKDLNESGCKLEAHQERLE